MIQPEQHEALRTATVDPDIVENHSTGAPGGEVFVPVEAVIPGVSSVTFSESDLGSYTLAYQDDNWFIIE